MESTWWETAAVYQLYVRSFSDANGDGIGDLQGITDKLAHIASLGVDAIWLNPCYPSPQRDHGYDVSDYFAIEPEYGTLAEFDHLVARATEFNLKIVMDVVANHCSDQHPWFVDAVAAGPGSQERERFWFRDGKGAEGNEPPNDWHAIFGGSAWTRVTEPDGSPGQWYLGVFTPYQPDFNWSSPDVAEHFADMFTFWFDRGVAGFRADAVTVAGKAPGLPDLGVPPHFGQGNIHYEHQPSGFASWEALRTVVDEYNAMNPGRDVFVIAEAYTPKRPDLFARYVNDKSFQQGFTFDLLMSPYRADQFAEGIQDTATALLPRGVSPAWALNNHDCERSVTRYGRPEATLPRDITGTNLIYSDSDVDIATGRRRALAATALMLALPGSVYLYMGEELGLPEVIDIPDEARQDPVFFQTDGEQRGRDGCRVPMPWTVDDAGAHGFSPAGAAAPWMPQPDRWGQHSVEAQNADAASTLATYRHAIAVRRKTASLRTAGLEMVPLGDDLVAFHRDDVLVVTNFGRAMARLPTDLVARRSALLSTAQDAHPTNELPPDTTTWLKL